MKGWKRFSLFHIIHKRCNRKYHGKTFIDFWFGLSRSKEFDLPINVIGFLLAIFAASYFGLGFWGFVIIDSIFVGSVSFLIAIIDTHNKYKFFIRKKTIESIYKTLEIKLDRWGSPIKEKKK